MTSCTRLQLFKATALWVALFASPLLAKDTAGVMLNAVFYHEQLTAAEWTASVEEYESPGPLRIEFNGIGFRGNEGGHSIGVMVMNYCPQYANDAQQKDGAQPGLTLYFSSLSHELNEGLELLADPEEGVCFRRLFENVDGMGTVGLNIYNTVPLRQPGPAHPVRIKWQVERGEQLVSPAGNFARELDGQWTPLEGVYREWYFHVSIEGEEQRVARYLLPESVAEFLSPSPVGFHQEHFGASTGDLHKAKTLIRYCDMLVGDESGHRWRLPCWKVISVIDDEWETKDKRFGWSVDRDNLVSRCGHETDLLEATRDLGDILLLDRDRAMQPPQAVTNEWTELRFSGQGTFLRTPDGSGTNAIGISSTTGIDAAWVTAIDIVPDAIYRFSANIKSEAVQPITGKGAILYSPNIPFEGQTISGTQDWVPVEVVFSSGQNDQCVVYCQLGGWGQASGEAWFADPRLELLAETIEHPFFKECSAEEGGLLRLSWDPVGWPMKLQSKDLLIDSAWRDVVGSDNTNTLAVPINHQVGLFRLKQVQ